MSGSRTSRKWRSNPPASILLSKKPISAIETLQFTWGVSIFIEPSKKIGIFLWKKIDIKTIDRFGPDGISELIKKLSAKAVKFQTGYIYQYAFIMLVGFSAFLTYLIIK